MNPMWRGGVIGGSKIIADPTAGSRMEGPIDHTFGSRTPVVEDDPNWRGFSIPEGVLIDVRKISRRK